ncbi:helix-turn-helix transcriptional regulator [Paraburkholderia sediminicola]|uniref:response regulator transcription factor n=1 Tax=Paraburkholderia sediminicola TaxID=458836 RepID=UPI0038BCB6EE
MLLNVDPFNPQGRHVNVSTRALGEVIESVGLPQFAQGLALFLHELIPLDCVHVERSRPDSGSPLGYRCEWIGSGAVDEGQDVVDDTMALYYERFQASDPLFAGIRGTTGTHLVVRDMSKLPAGEFRELIFESRQIAHECVLTKGGRHAQYSLAIVRREDQPQFSLAELNHLRHLGDFLFPLLQLHASTAAIKRTANTITETDPLVLFDARIASDGIRLSKREYEICRHLLAGRTVPETAAILGVRQTSAESYVQRAFAKLGVRTKRDLARWAFGDRARPDEAGLRPARVFT